MPPFAGSQSASYRHCGAPDTPPTEAQRLWHRRGAGGRGRDGAATPRLSGPVAPLLSTTIFPCNGTSPATLRCGWRTVSVAPSTKPWSSPNTAPARHTGVVSQHRRPQGKSWPCSGHRPTGVISPAWATQVRQVAPLFPRDLLPSSLFTTPLRSSVPVSRGTATCVVSTRWLRNRSGYDNRNHAAACTC
jgi:hypothetical protein